MWWLMFLSSLYVLGSGVPMPLRTLNPFSPRRDITNSSKEFIKVPQTPPHLREELSQLIQHLISSAQRQLSEFEKFEFERAGDMLKSAIATATRERALLEKSLAKGTISEEYYSTENDRISSQLANMISLQDQEDVDYDNEIAKLNHEINILKDMSHSLQQVFMNFIAASVNPDDHQKLAQLIESLIFSVASDKVNVTLMYHSETAQLDKIITQFTDALGDIKEAKSNGWMPSEEFDQMNVYFSWQLHEISTIKDDIKKWYDAHIKHLDDVTSALHRISDLQQQLV